MKDLTKVLFWYGPVELARGPFKKLNGPLDHLIFFMQRTIQDFPDVYNSHSCTRFCGG